MFTKKNKASVTLNIEERIKKMSSDYAVELTYMKSTGTIEPEGNENMILIEGERVLYKNQDAHDSHDIYEVATK